MANHLLYDALRDAHTLYVNAVGAHIATLERFAHLFDADITEELAVLREKRALAELRCRRLQATFEEGE